MKKILVILPIIFLLSVESLLAQTPTKPKHLLPNGEPDRPFTFFVKHGFASYTDATTRAPFGARPAYFVGGGVRVEDDDKDSPAFLEFEGFYHQANQVDTTSTSLNNIRINMNVFFVLTNNAAKSFRWTAGTGFGYNIIKDEFISKKTNQVGFNFSTATEMLLKHKRFNLFANYHILPFPTKGIEQYNFNTISLGMGFYFR